MQVSEPVILSTWSASNFCQVPGDNSLFLTVSPDFLCEQSVLRSLMCVWRTGQCNQLQR
eukprot:COSAG02_NODE_1437_length_12606_cov_5.043336_10_plen_59_part_00